MKNFKLKMIVMILPLAAASASAAAGYKGSVSFSKSEIRQHQEKIESFTGVAANCLNGYREEHLNFYDSNCRVVNGKRVCLSKFYGDRKYSKMKGDARPDGTPLKYLNDALREIGFPTEYVNKMESTSCVGMTMDCLKKAFRATGQSAQWKKVRHFTVKNGVGGTALQTALRQLGWKTYYWNPSAQDVIHRNMARWDAEEKNWASKGYHAHRYNNVKKKGRYYLNRVDNSTDLVGFGDSQPELLKRVSFWVGTAHTGYHVFPGTYGRVVEAHSTRKITAEDNLEFSTFSPFAPGGGPRWTKTEKYRSGLISIPPQSL